MAKKLIEIEGEFTQENILKALAQYIEGVIGGKGRWAVGQRLVQLALRSAARVLPLIVENDGLSFFGNVDNQLRQLAKLLHIVSYISNRSYPDAGNYGNLAVHYVELQSNVNRATDFVIDVVNAAAAAATDIGMPNASITTLASSGAVISNVEVSFGYLDCRFVDEWKQDFQHMQLSGDLWDESLWRSLSDSYRKTIHHLFAIVDTLREQQLGTSEEWSKIDAGMAYLKEQLGIADITVEEPTVDSYSAAKFQINYAASRRQLPEVISNEDHLNRLPLISALASILAHETNCEHQTIGLLGDWGIGKSTWLRLLKKELLKEHKEQVYLFGEFNAWAYEHTDNLQAGIAQEVVKALSSPATRLEDIDHALAGQKKESRIACTKRWLGWKCDRAILTIKFAWLLNEGELLKLVFLLMLALCPLVLSIPELISDYLASKAATQTQALYRGAGVVGNALWFLGFGVYFVKELPKLFANPLAKEMLTYLRLPDYAKHLGAVPVMRKNIETLCKVRLKSDSEKPSRLLFVVDDLDRCGHDGIVKVFEAVRLVLDIKNVTVIIAVDQHIALAALALHYKDLAEHHKLKNPRAIARDYLAKVIHLPIILAKPMGADIANYLQKLWHASTSDTDRVHIEKEQQDYEQQLAVAPVGKSQSEIVQIDGSSAQEIPDGVNQQQDKVTALGVATISTEETEFNDDKLKAAKLVEVASLSAAQRRDFIYWLDYFGLSNPRQLKRLNNSYNLLLSCYREIDRLPVITELVEPMPKALFPMMMTLIVMEYLNSLEDQALRNRLRVSLFKKESAGSGDAQSQSAQGLFINSGWPASFSGMLFESKQQLGVDERVTDVFIAAIHRLLEESENLAEIVEPFVLPAIESAG